MRSSRVSVFAMNDASVLYASVLCASVLDAMRQLPARSRVEHRRWPELGQDPSALVRGCHCARPRGRRGAWLQLDQNDDICLGRGAGIDAAGAYGRCEPRAQHALDNIKTSSMGLTEAHTVAIATDSLPRLPFCVDGRTHGLLV
jgi:hypothetical protein